MIMKQARTGVFVDWVTIPNVAYFSATKQHLRWVNFTSVKKKSARLLSCLREQQTETPPTRIFITKDYHFELGISQ